MSNYPIEEKAFFLEGKNVWETKSLENGKGLFMADGPHGLRKQLSLTDNLGLKGSYPAVCYPTASLLACSFDPLLTNRLGFLLAKEAKALQVGLVLGPGINIKRSPLCGRNFEYFSEDPLLTAKMASSYVNGLEKENVGCSVKHFCCNNQETLRYNVDAVVDERTLHEIYLKVFYEVIKEKPASIMASYNKINGYYATEHPILLDILRNKWGYNGLVISDWGAISNPIKALNYGCDLQMPTSNGYYIDLIIKEAKVSLDLASRIDSSSKRIIKAINKYQNPEQTVDLELHHQEAYKMAVESIVLLKNDNILPLKENDEVLFIGAFLEKFRYQGAGSSFVNSYRVDEIAYILKQKKLDYCLGYKLTGDGFDEALFQEASTKAQAYEKIVLFLGLPQAYETEGLDRKNLDLPSGQIKLLKKLLEINPNIVCVVLAGSVVNLVPLNQAKGLLYAYLSGEAGALAIMDLLYGIKNPSGRLAETFIEKVEDSNIKINKNLRIFYDETIFVGYRYYNTFDKDVVYPFGYGLSYSKFTYRRFNISSRIFEKELIVKCKIKNNGPYDGAEVVQLYIENNHSSVYKAKRELRKFQKIFLKVNEEKDLTFKLTKDDFSYYDVNLKKFIANTGEYKIQLAHNVNDIICEEFVVIVDEDPLFKEHEKTSYHKKQYDTSDFNKLIKKDALVPSPKIRPFTLDSTLQMLRFSFIGFIIGQIIIKKANKISSKQEMLNFKAMLLQTPLRIIGQMSEGILPLSVCEGIIDLCNYRLIKGLKKIKKGLKKNEDKVV